MLRDRFSSDRMVFRFTSPRIAMSTSGTSPVYSAKGPLLVIPPEQAHSHWMPDNGGYTNIIVSPWDHPMVSYTMGTQRLMPGEVVPEHHHDRHEELFYVFSGSGEAVLDGNPYRFGAGHTLFFGRNISHSITNT